MQKLRLIAARSGVTTGENPRPWGNATFVMTETVHGAQVDIVAGLFVGKELADKLGARLTAAKAAGTQLTVDVDGLALSTDRNSYTADDGTQKWRTNHSIVGGKFGPVVETARSTSRADIAALAA